VFPQLNREELLQIVDLFIARLGDRLTDRDLTLSLTKPAKERLIEVGYEPALGARPLRRVVQREIEDSISERILQGEITSIGDITVDYQNGEFVFKVKSRRSEVVA
jgi:ATP-dependent Clp protease ATP-binding subunit ClpC